MAKHKTRVDKHPDDMTPEELRADIAKLEKRLEEANRDIDWREDEYKKLKSKAADLEEQIKSGMEEFLRDQLDTLAVDPPTATPEQMTRLCNGILRGEDWRHGTWR